MLAMWASAAGLGLCLASFAFPPHVQVFQHEGLPGERSATTSAGKVTYAYYLDGLLHTAVHQDTGWVDRFIETRDYEEAGRLTSLETRLTDSGTPLVRFGYAYDDNGNRVEEGPRRYAWDIRDTLTQVTDGASVLGGYDYDASLQRVKADTASGHVEYVLDGKYVLRESGARTRRYHYGEGKGLSVDDGGGARWLSLDGLGSTSAEVTPRGSVTANRKHDAWGNYRDGTAPASGEVRLGYTGHQYDVETGLTYARARYYDSVNGVFLSRDSYAGQLDDAPSLHRYAYAHGNPLRYTDPQGRAVNVAAAGIGAGIGFLVGFGAALWDGDSLGDAALTGAKTAAVGALAGLTFGASLAAGAGVGAVAAATGGKLALGAAASYGHQQLEIQAGVRSEVSAKDIVLGAAASAAVPTGKAFTVAPQAVKLALGGLAVGGGAVAVGTGGAQVAEAMEMADSPSPALQARAPWMGALGATNTVLGLVGIGAGAKIMPSPGFVAPAAVGPVVAAEEQALLPIFREREGQFQALIRSNEGTGPVRWTNVEGPPSTAVHGNSLAATGPHDVYAVRARMDQQVNGGGQVSAGQILHFGESGRGWQKRGGERARYFRQEYGIETFTDQLSTVEGKAAAKTSETKYIDTYEKVFGRKPGFEDASGNWVNTQKTRH